MSDYQARNIASDKSDPQNWSDIDIEECQKDMYLRERCSCSWDQILDCEREKHLKGDCFEDCGLCKKGEKI